MPINHFLSEHGHRIRNRLNFTDDPPEWGLRAKQAASSNPDFLDATVGTAQNESGFHYFPTLLKEIQTLSSEETLAYANMRGVPAFSRAWKFDTINSYHPSLRDKAKILTSDPVPIAGGLTGALFTVGQLFADQETHLLAPSSRWGNIDNCFGIGLDVPIHSFDIFSKDGHFTFDHLRSKIEDVAPSASRLIIYLNFPNNPTGYMPNFKEIEELQDIFKAISLPTIVLLDDAYEGYVYPDESFPSQENPIPHSIFPYLFGINSEILPIKIDGPTKRFCAYGTRLGVISLGFHSETDQKTDVQVVKTGLNVSEVFVKAARSHCSSAPRGIQEALGRILSDNEKYKAILEEREAFRSMLEQRYRFFLRVLQEQDPNPILKPLTCNSGFFAFFLVQDLSARVLAAQLLEKGLGVVPFMDNQTGFNGVRFAFCSLLEKDISPAIEILWRVSTEMCC
ncbi:MAG: aminotransferase class I/II-fold pyridoxal phosphate-dependent enzyme [Candidatus Heimdallarchaeota archaeon]|nr:MAG: aminotransferase class I/II-fold pyridoxal phosphate-dependent enzyme [Candidatus Heimdallarchaeota archaeon]